MLLSLAAVARNARAFKLSPVIHPTHTHTTNHIVQHRQQEQRQHAMDPAAADLPLLVPFPRTPFHPQRVTILLPSSASSSSLSPSGCSIRLPAGTSSTRVGEVKTALFQALAMAPAAATTTSSSSSSSSSNEPWCTLTLGKPPAFHPAAQRSDVQPLLTRGPDSYVLLLTKLKGETANTFLDDKEFVAVGQQEWRLVPAHELPPARFLVRVTGTRRNMDAFGKEYIAYEITVKNGLLTWQLSKRYSDFAAMHEKLKKHEQQQQQQQQKQGEEVAAFPLPDLPPKLFQNVQGRQERLETYLQQVVDRPFSMENPHVLAFLGILSSMSAELSALDANTDINDTTSKMKKRQVLHISALKKTLQMGDIVLFQCAHNLAGLQRTVTRAEWDHGRFLGRFWPDIFSLMTYSFHIMRLHLHLQFCFCASPCQQFLLYFDVHSFHLLLSSPRPPSLQ